MKAPTRASASPAWEDPTTLCWFSTGEVAVLQPPSCSALPAAGPHHPAAPRYLAAPQNTPGVWPPSIRLSIRPSILRSLEFGLGGGSVAADVEQQQEAEAERGGGAHGQGLAQHQQRVDGTWKRGRGRCQGGYRGP